MTVPEPRANKQAGKQGARSECDAQSGQKGVVQFLEGLNWLVKEPHSDSSVCER